MIQAAFRWRTAYGRWAVVCALAASALHAWEPEPLAPDPARTIQKGVIIRLEGMITPMTGAFLERKVKEARKQGADLLIIEWDSPGGYLDTSLEIAALLRDIGWARTVAYVPKMALSGAAIAALGCDDIVMGGNAVIGDAGPIVKEWEDGAFRHAPEKVRSDLIRRVRDLAEAKNRPPALAEAMVDMNQQVYRMENAKTNEVAYMTDIDWQTAPDAADWTQGPLVPESREGLFLEVNGRRAVELQIAKNVCESRQELSEIYGLNEPPKVVQSNTVDTLVLILNSPLVTVLLFLVGLVALYIEFSSPGLGFGAMLAGLCFVLFFWSRVLGGTAGALEILLFLSGVGFLAMEIFVVPGFGITGLTGVLLILSSLVLATQNFVIPATTRQLTDSAWSATAVVGGFALSLIALMLSGKFLHNTPLLSRLALAPPAEADEQELRKAAGKDPLPSPPYAVGDWGVASSALRPAGRAQFGDVYVDVVADGSFVEPGQQIRIVMIQGNRIVVQTIA